MDKDHHQITLAYFEQRSTVDYIGAVQGIPVCFDAKECSTDTFPLSNIHSHQVAFMKAFEEQGGVAFFLLFFSSENIFYYLPLRQLLIFWERMEKGGRKSFRREELEQQFIFPDRADFLFLIWRAENRSEFTGLTSDFSLIIILLFNIVLW